MPKLKLTLFRGRSRKYNVPKSNGISGIDQIRLLLTACTQRVQRVPYSRFGERHHAGDDALQQRASPEAPEGRDRLLGRSANRGWCRGLLVISHSRRTRRLGFLVRRHLWS